MHAKSHGSQQRPQAATAASVLVRTRARNATHQRAERVEVARVERQPEALRHRNVQLQLLCGRFPAAVLLGGQPDTLIRRPNLAVDLLIIDRIRKNCYAPNHALKSSLKSSRNLTSGAPPTSTWPLTVPPSRTVHGKIGGWNPTDKAHTERLRHLTARTDYYYYHTNSYYYSNT